MCGPYDSAARPAFPGFGRALELPKGVRLGVTNVEARGLWELPIDLDWVATVLEGDPMRSQGAFLDLTTGEVIHSSMIDFVAADGEGSATMLAEPDRWLFLPSSGSRAVRQDMADFAAMITYLPLRKRVTEAIEGLGAFHRFRDLIHSEGLVEEWHAFADYRRIARAREFLADLGVHVAAY
jgi:hypothetical protein